MNDTTFLIQGVSQEPCFPLCPRIDCRSNHNQLHEVKVAGFDIKPSRVVEEQISGSVPTSDRKGFQSLLSKMEDSVVLEQSSSGIY